MLEKFKKFPVLAQVVICLELLGSVIGTLGLMRLLNMANKLSFIYQLAGENVPSKFSLYLGIIVGFLLIGSLFRLVSNPNKQSLMIYFGIIIFNLIINTIINGFGLATIIGLVLPGIMAYTVNQNRDFFGI